MRMQDHRPVSCQRPPVLEEARTAPERLKQAPSELPVDRLDEVKAAREPNLRWKPS